MKEMKRWLAILLAVLLAGCSGNSGTSDAGADGQDGGDSNQGKCGNQYCAASQDCLAGSVCVTRPAETARACVEDQDNLYHEVADADLACHNDVPCQDNDDCPQEMICHDGTCGIPAPQGPQTVTFRGCVDAFGIGDTTHQMRIALYLANQDPSGASSWDMATTEDKQNCEYWGAFEFTDVPTNTPLILKTYDDQGDFVTVYKYNLILWADLATQEGNTWVFDTRSNASDPRTGQEISLHPWRGYAISQATYNIILMAVGVNLGDNEGAIAGTIRDCGYQEMEYVQCNTSTRPQVVTYFTNAENPRPDHSRDSTNVNGIYAAIGLEAGSHDLACLARNADGAAVPLGSYTVKVFPHSITILSFDWYPAVP